MDIKEPREDRRRDFPIPGEYGFPIPRELFFRELGFSGVYASHNFPRHNVGKKLVSQSLATKAVHTLCTKDLTRRRFKLPNGARTTFHIAFSADGTKVASCHGDHNVYVCDVASGDVLQTLSGHPRTPWCVVFHPTQNDVLASGCLAGHVRVWDLKGGSELLITDSGTVIASLAFHPTVRLLAIATFNEIIFWDWGHPYPLARCSTENTKEKVRLVRFDSLGRSLITGITNFPSPPSREEVRRSVRGGGPTFRPNILSRNYRSRRSSPMFASGSRDDMDGVEDVAMVNENEEVVVPDPEETDAEVYAVAAAAVVAADLGETLNARQDRFQESYRQLVSHYEELVSNYQQFLRSRIPRILDNSSPVLNRIPMPLSESVAAEVLETHLNAEVADNQMDENLETDAFISSNPVSEAVEDEPGSITTLESPASPVVMDDEVPGPSRLIFESTQERAIDVPDEDNMPTSSTRSSRSHDSTSATAGRSDGQRSDTDLRSIEALAQNILEMQNLCSQVRMDAPLAVENQHIMELRVIRRHLELLQEQTRDLQSSIRATLNSLASGSLAALRSHVANAANNSSTNQDPRDAPPITFPNLEQATPPTPVGPGPTLDFSPPASPVNRTGVTNSDSSSSASSDFPRRLRAETVPTSATRSTSNAGGNGFTSNRTNSSNSSNSSGGGQGSLYPTMITIPYTESGRLPNQPLFNRIRVPPMVAMQYEVADSFSRNLPGPSRTTENQEPVAGPSRNANNNSSSNNNTNNDNNNSSNSGSGRGRGEGSGPRRIVREFQLIGGRTGTFVAEEHARHCPFSGRDPYHWRPPPRMRSLYDMGEMPPLVTWPTMETGLETSIRSFREVTLPLSNRTVRNPLSSIMITVRNGLGPNGGQNMESSVSNAPSRNSPFMNFSQWLFASGINLGNISSDVLVGVYLTIRQLSSGSNDTSQNEQWQQVFGNVVPGLALIPSSLRQGQRLQHQPHRCQHRRRRTHWICYSHSHNGSSHRPCSIPVSRGSSSSNVQDDSSQTNITPVGTPTHSIFPSSRNTPDEPLASSSPGSADTTPKPTATATTSARPMPHQLEKNFTRVFYIRAGDELIPVYSTVNSSESTVGTEVRESLQASVYYLPIGLFLQGGPWENNTQTIGIHWPPVTREEEYAVLDLRVSERPLSVYDTDTRESYPNNRRYPRIRINYDQTSLRVTLPTGFSLNFIQSGLTLLDCISTSINLPRPRPIEGTLWIDYLGPFLDALERMFGLRHSRRTLGSLPSGHRVGAFLGRTPPWVHAGNVRPSLFSNSPQQPQSSSSSGSNGSADSNSRSPANLNNGNGGGSNSANINGNNRTSIISRVREIGERVRTMTRRVITLAPDAPVDPRRRFYDDNPMILSHGFMYESPGPNVNGAGVSGYRPFFERSDDRRFFFRHRHRHDFSQHSSSSPTGASSQGQQRGDGVRDGSDGGRFIRLAVDTAASEVLRMNQHLHHHHHHHHSDGLPETNNGLPVVEAGSASGFSAIGRPVESRIERVLNERGNRGAHSPSPPGLMDEPSRNRMRLEEIQRRINMLSHWSRARAMATSGTQTPHSFVRASWLNPAERPAAAQSSQSSSERERQQRQALNTPASGPSTSSAGSNSGSSNTTEPPPRISRRRPYSRIARLLPNDGDDNSDDDILVALPARIPRLSDPIFERPSRSDGQRGGSRHQVDHWVLRSLHPHSSGHRYSPMAELPGSARTRAPPQNRYSSESAEPNSSTTNNNESEPVRPRFQRVSRVGAAGGAANGSATNNTSNNNNNTNNDGNNNNVGGVGDDPGVYGGPRFYPGYIPEILITPRTRPPTYYTMDAATTAFLSSRIQKWDFSEFLIPDITKREESVVVRECSLHSDACLDVSADCEFLAVLQPSDSGSYSSVGIYSLRDDSLGEVLDVYHFDQNTVSVSISPSCDYLVVGYAGRGPLYRFVHPSRNIGKILSLTRDEEGFKLVSVKDLYADGQVAFMSINCMHWVPVAGYGIIYGTNTGDLVLLS